MAKIITLSEADVGILQEMIDEFRNRRQNVLQEEPLEGDLQFRNLYAGKTDAAHAKGTFGTISIFGGRPGSESDTGWNKPGVYNGFADLASGALVVVATTSGGEDYLIAGECGTLGT